MRLILMFVLLLCGSLLHAQSDTIVVARHNLPDGSTETVKQYRKNGRTYKVSYIDMPTMNKPVNPDTLNKDSVVLVVDKAHYKMYVYYKNKPIKVYKVVFGPKPLEDKKMEGDRCTPEGCFTIKQMYQHKEWNKFMLFDYPNESSFKKFNDRKAKGMIPVTATIGNSIGIHGVWKNADRVIDEKHNWTDGCVSMKNSDVEELFTLVKVGTKIYIRK